MILCLALVLNSSCCQNVLMPSNWCQLGCKPSHKLKQMRFNARHSNQNFIVMFKMISLPNITHLFLIRTLRFTSFKTSTKTNFISYEGPTLTHFTSILRMCIFRENYINSALNSYFCVWFLHAFVDYKIELLYNHNVGMDIFSLNCELSLSVGWELIFH